MRLFESNSPERTAVSARVENVGDNYGVEVAKNDGSIAIYQGMGYKEVKELCLDLISDEMRKYKAEAFVEAGARRDDLDNEFARKMYEKQLSDQQALAEFSNPAMQYDYFEAQKAYIKAGTPELCSILSDILVQRVGESSRTLLQIALGEAIQVAPKLIPSQMASLALVFNLYHTVLRSINSHEDLAEHLMTRVLPIFRKGVSQKWSEFQHLNYSGCSQFQTFNKSLPERLRDAYAGLFMKGFADDVIPKDAGGTSLREQYPNLFTRCMNDVTRWQIDAMTEEMLQRKCESVGTPQDDRAKLVDLFKSNQMNDEETEMLVCNILPEMQEVCDYWKNSGTARLALTSVGIIIGAQYSKLITGQEYDLKIWI